MVSHGANIFFGGDFSHIDGRPARVGKVNAGGGTVVPLPAIAHGQHQLQGGKILSLVFVAGEDLFLYAGGSFEERAVRWKLAQDGDTVGALDSEQRWHYQGLHATPGPVRAILPLPETDADQGHPAQVLRGDCPGNCSGRGTCMNTICLCDPGWSGQDCAAPIQS